MLALVAGTGRSLLRTAVTQASWAPALGIAAAAGAQGQAPAAANLLRSFAFQGSRAQPLSLQVAGKAAVAAAAAAARVGCSSGGATTAAAAAASQRAAAAAALQRAATTAAAAAAAGRSHAAATAPWRAATATAAAAAAGRQQARGYARYLQFQPRGGGMGSWGRGLDPDRVVWGLIGANVLGFLLWRVSPQQMSKHATVSIESLRSGRLWTAVTNAFSHAALGHLGANMIGLYFFGRNVGHFFGGKQLLLLYLAGGVAGGLAHCGWYYYKACKTGEGRYGRARWFGFAPSALGASAAVNAIMTLSILLWPTSTILLYGIIPVPAALLGAFWLYSDITGAAGGGHHIAHAGHLGGAATGLAFWLLYRRGLIRPQGWR